MPDFNPIVLRRMLALRQFPMLAGIDLDELATVAENVVEASFPAGTVIACPGGRLPAVHLIIDGGIEFGPHARVMGPRHVFGALEVLAGRGSAASAVAATPTQTLQLSAPDLGEILEDNFGILLSTLRDLADRLMHVAPSPSRSAFPAHTGRLGLVERLILLRQQLPFATARLQALATVARAAEEISWPTGTIVSTAGDPAVSALVVIEGALRASDHGGATRVLRAGDPLGYLETLAGRSHSITVEALTPVRVLRNAGPDLLDVLEDHTDLGLTMIATFAGALLDASVAPERNDVN